MGGLYIEGISLEGFMRPQLLPLFTSQQNSSVLQCAPAMMCSLATNLQMWCHMTMGWNPYNFRPQIPFSPYKVFISVVSVYSVRKLTNPYTDPEWKGNRSQVTGFLFFYSEFDWMFRGILTSWSIKESSGYSERQTGSPHAGPTQSVEAQLLLMNDFSYSSFWHLTFSMYARLWFVWLGLSLAHA